MRTVSLAGASALAVALLALALGSDRAAQAEDAEAIALGRTVYLETSLPQCGVCHALKDAGTEGEIGPNFDEMQPDASQVYAAVSQGVGVMPSFADSLSEEEMRAVAAYVEAASQP